MNDTDDSAFAAPPRASLGQAEVCIIGAGVSGLTALKALQAQGISAEAFEQGSALGGLWRYENDSGLSSAYRNLHIDSSRKSLGFPDFPTPEHWPDYPSHGQILAWLEAYAEAFALRDAIHFRHTVQRAVPAAGGGWDVTVQPLNGRALTRRYRAVVVANGHLSAPRMAVLPGQFDGQQLHAQRYRTATPFENQRVLVIGMGNSAVDIAVDLTRQASQVTLSTRRGAHVMPKYLFGWPTDRVGAAISRTLRWPTRYTRTVLGQLARLTLGNQERQGVPRPPHPIWREHACVSQELLSCVGHGTIGIKPDVRRLAGTHVEFADGSREAFDTVIHATGYRVDLPFLPADVFQIRDHEARLYRRIAAPDRPGLYFVGLVQPIGPTIPLVEVQSRWVARVLAGRLTLPDASTMHVEIERHLAALRRNFVDSARYTLEVDFREHSRQLQDDIASGMAAG